MEKKIPKLSPSKKPNPSKNEGLEKQGIVFFFSPAII
jgi:hypothetical protein